MARYKIAWLPGDGIGVDVSDAAKIVLKKIQLDAEYIRGDIVWKCWRTEGDALPPRTINFLKNVDAELSGALAQLAKPFAPFAKLSADQFAVSCKINTVAGSERIVRAAFDFARKSNRKKVTVVHKANVVRATDGLFLEAAKKVAKEF